MVKTNIGDGGPAFPAGTHHTHDKDGQSLSLGMTLRDWFAGQALSGMLAYGEEYEPFAERAYLIADMMIKARE
jgi:hypothetical protein